MKLLIVLLVGMGAASAEEPIAGKKDTSAELSCEHNGHNYQPYVLETDIFVGKETYGFTNENTCVDNIKVSNIGIVCNWNGSGYTPYNFRNNRNIGKTDFGYQELASCKDALG